MTWLEENIEAVGTFVFRTFHAFHTPSPHFIIIKRSKIRLLLVPPQLECHSLHLTLLLRLLASAQRECLGSSPQGLGIWTDRPCNSTRI